MVVFQVLTWEAQDTEDEHLISIFGKTLAVGAKGAIEPDPADGVDYAGHAC